MQNFYQSNRTFDMATQTFHLAGKIYTVKDRIKERVRSIVANATLGTALIGDDHLFMANLFTYHPAADNKIGAGIERIEVRRAERNAANREFWIRQTHSKVFTDISWTECLSATTEIAEFANACRLAVKPITQAYCDREFKVYGHSGALTCPITGHLFTRENADVDHDEPWPMRLIVSQFVESHSIDLKTVAYDGFEHGSTFITLRNVELAAKFVAYHNTVAKLQVLSREGHRQKNH